MRNTSISCCGAALVLALSFSSAHADIIFTAGNGPATVDNVVFNLQPPLQSGSLIFGNLNDAADTLVQFSGIESLITPSGGQARIEASDGTLTFLGISLAAAETGFDSFIANLNSPNGAGGVATITATNQFGSSETFSLILGNGQNFFTLTTDAAQFITDVTFSSPVGLTDVRQIRLGEVQAVPGPLVGAGIPGIVAALGTLVVLARRRRARSEFGAQPF